jgi:hypothetical protein
VFSPCKSSSPVYEELWLREELNISIHWERNLNNLEIFIVKKRKSNSASADSGLKVPLLVQLKIFQNLTLFPAMSPKQLHTSLKTVWALDISCLLEAAVDKLHTCRRENLKSHSFSFMLRPLDTSQLNVSKAKWSCRCEVECREVKSCFIVQGDVGKWRDNVCFTVLCVTFCLIVTYV